MRTYLENLITEKGVDLESEIKIEGHIGCRPPRCIIISHF